VNSLGPGDGPGTDRREWLEADPEQMPLGRLLAWTGQAVSAYYRQTVLTHGLSATGLAVLGVLADTDALSHRDLAGCLGITPATLTSVIDALSDQGVVVRKRDASDRRVVRVWITPAGRARLQSTRASVAATLRDRIPDLPPDQERIVRAYLLAVLAAVDLGSLP
jgi:MarR family transcriptional regulator, organic hydroperoxide resistance regulator